ncbi:hypothetical protein ACFPOD_17190 [Nitratireductor kimnyeongensis]|uniref:Outer membrane protein beta-barrel domain-containing protein n=1 Tax=Nitratireductor kimnyeongensis TaxID=430679 RepID=A0ABW0TDX5_9HYPH|nr:hypothetical protein [Nitratireductor kimnyeongensis]
MRLTILALACGIATTTGVSASDISTTPELGPEQDRPWALQISPYVWATGLDGHISPFRHGPTIGIKKSFSDVIDDLDFAGFVNLWGRYERFVFSADMMYVSTTDSKVVQGSIPRPPLSVRLGASIDTKQFTSTLQAGYRVIETPEFTLDMLGGVRFWHISNDVDLDVQVGGLRRTLRYGESFNWVDPIVGARAFLNLTDKLSVQAQADIGGFGAGAKSTWSVLATANYTLTDHLSLSAGYKHLEVDYEDDGHVFDATMSGPVLGITYRF